MCLVISDSLSTPWMVAHQASLSMKFPRQKYWSALPFLFPGDLPHLGGGGVLPPTSTTWEDSLAQSACLTRGFPGSASGTEPACQCKRWIGLKRISTHLLNKGKVVIFFLLIFLRIKRTESINPFQINFYTSSKLCISLWPSQNTWVQSLLCYRTLCWWEDENSFTFF